MTPWTAATLAEWTLDLDTGDLPDAAFADAASASMLDMDDGQQIRLWCDQGRTRHGPDEFRRAR